MVNCATFRNIQTCTESDWRRKHDGHKIEEIRQRIDGKRTVRGLHCNDCAARWATLEMKTEIKDAGIAGDVEGAEAG